MNPVRAGNPGSGNLQRPHWFHRGPSGWLRTKTSKLRFGFIGLLLTLMLLLSVDSMRRESVTFDEPLHLTAGYAAWVYGDYRLQESQGILPQRWFALPLLFSKVRFPSRDDVQWRKPGYQGLVPCQEFLFGSGNDSGRIVFQGRLMAVFLAMATALAIFYWGIRAFGAGAGLLACFFCALDPTMLAHGHLMTSDVPVALLFLMSAGSFWSLLRRFTFLRLAASTVCFGLLLVSKMSGGLAVVMAALMFLSRIALRRSWPVGLGRFTTRLTTIRTKALLAGGTAVVHVLGAVVIVWCFYGWQYQPGRDWDVTRDSYTEPRAAVFDSLGTLRPAFAALEQLEVLPDAYLYGLAHTVKHSEKRPAFLNGQYSSTGWWYYFPYCFLVKTPLPLLALLALGGAVLAFRFLVNLFHFLPRAGTRDRIPLSLSDGERVAECRARGPMRSFQLRTFLAWLDRTSFLWSLLLVYGLAGITTNLNIGHRHLLPLYPPLFILAGAAGAWGLRGRWSRWFVLILPALQLIDIATIHPHYLAYFNALAGGPTKGYLHLSDSNVDWGQDLPSLRDWLIEHRNQVKQEDLYVSCFGFDQPERWGIQAYHLPDFANPSVPNDDLVRYRPGTYCISATALIWPSFGKPPWDETREREYVELLRLIRQLEPLRPADSASVKTWSHAFSVLADRQFHRLRSYLMHRTPDAMVGYSILVFQLSDTDLRAALVPIHGKPQ
jgi:4-amino-4-deoxy-L-arabinose transferase-like glycosyltransferase